MDLNYGLLSALFPSGIPALIYFTLLFAVMLIAYLLGSLNSAIIISRLVYKDDIKTKGSGNAGLTNMLRSFGGRAALLTLFGDLFKTALAIGLAGLLFGFMYAGGISFSEPCYLAGLFAVLGHIFPVFYKFKGGKGVLVTSAMALFLTPLCFLVLLVIFVIIVAISKYVSLGSVSVAFLYPVVLSGYLKMFGAPTPGLMMAVTALLAVIIIVCHRKNLERISNRTENKLSFKKKEKSDE